MGATITIALVAIGMIAIIIWLMITRGLQLKQLVEDGIDGSGTVVRQFKRNPKKSSLSTDHWLRYRYHDPNGAGHECESNVNRDYWIAHPEGSVIAITHSKSKPQISAPRHLVEQAREALAKRK